MAAVFGWWTLQHLLLRRDFKTLRIWHPVSEDFFDCLFSIIFWVSKERCSVFLFSSWRNWFFEFFWLGVVASPSSPVGHSEPERVFEPMGCRQSMQKLEVYRGAPETSVSEPQRESNPLGTPSRSSSSGEWRLEKIIGGSQSRGGSSGLARKLGFSRSYLIIGVFGSLTIWCLGTSCRISETILFLDPCKVDASTSSSFSVERLSSSLIDSLFPNILDKSDEFCFIIRQVHI